MATQPNGDAHATAQATDTPGGPRLSALDMTLGIIGAVAGACVGYLLFRVMARQGVYAIVLPGALTGIACGSLSRGKSVPLGIACALIGLAAGIFAEWRFAPFIEDDGLPFFLRHIHQLTPVSQILILLGACLAFWFGLGRTGGAWLRQRRRHAEK